MGRAALMNMLHRHSEYLDENPRVRHDELSVGDDATSADIMPRANRSKISLAFGHVPLRQQSIKRFQFPKYSPLKKLIIRPTARGLESLLLRFGDKSCDSDPLTIQQSDTMGRTQMAEAELTASSLSPGIGSKETLDSRWTLFNEKLEHCKRMLRDLAEEALLWSKLAEPAGDYFDIIARDIEAELTRLDLWAVREKKLQRLKCGNESSRKAMKYAIETFGEIMSAAENIRKQVELLGSLASQGSAESTIIKSASVDSLSDQESDDEEVARDMKTSFPLAGQEEDLASMAADLARKLESSASQIYEESKCIELDVSFLKRITDALHVPRATTEEQDGPQAAPRQEMPRARSRAEARGRARGKGTEMGRGAQTPTVRGAVTSWYLADDDDDDDDDYDGDGTMY